MEQTMPELDQDPLDPEISEPSEETPEGENPDSEPEGEEKDKGPKHIPYDRFQEVWNERQDARQYAQNLQLQILQMQQQIQSAQHQANQPRQPQIDPEIDQIVAPVVQQRTAHLERQLAQMQQQLLGVQAKGEAESAWNYVLQYVPDMDELKSDIAREIEKKSPAIQKKITSDPDLVIELAEKVRLMRSSGAASTGKKIQADLKGRTRSESGGTGTNPNRGNNNDWLNMTDAEFDAANERIQRQRRGY
jgi:hypothetical protein